jgi:hypothetical protein
VNLRKDHYRDRTVSTHLDYRVCYRYHVFGQTLRSTFGPENPFVFRWPVGEYL